ncbi:hypothetical protein BH11PLA2_BH11PLA2_26000 [soil metagenome]
MGWVFFAIFVGIAIVSALSHVLKNQQQADEPSKKSNKKRQPNREEKVRLSNDDEQDRFLAEIERLRKKATTGTASGNKPIPTVKQANPQVKKQQPKQTQSQIRKRLDEIPAAVVIPTGKPKPHTALTMSIPEMGTVATIATVHTIASIADVMKPTAAGGTTAGKMNTAISATSRPDPTTPFGANLVALLKSGGSMPMAVVLQEILGPPRCRKQH